MSLLNPANQLLHYFSSLAFPIWSVSDSSMLLRSVRLSLSRFAYCFITSLVLLNLSTDISERFFTPHDDISPKSVSTNSHLFSLSTLLIQLLNALLSLLLCALYLLTVTIYGPDTCHDMASCCIIPVCELFTMI